jgi:hypothetical protein
LKFHWPWTKRDPLPSIPPYESIKEKAAAANVARASDPGIHVEEHDADDEALAALRRAQTETGIHRAWKRITGK